MKKILLIFMSLYLTKGLDGQTITPSLSDEYCPNVEYTFTVTISKSFSSIVGEGGCIITQQPSNPVGSTFTFKGKFADLNQKQTFRVTFS